MTAWDVLTGRASVPAGMLAEVAALRGYDVGLISHGPARRFEAVRRGPGPGIWCVVSTDPADLWRELADRASPRRGTGQAALLRSARTATGSCAR